MSIFFSVDLVWTTVVIVTLLGDVMSVRAGKYESFLSAMTLFVSLQQHQVTLSSSQRSPKHFEDLRARRFVCKNNCA